MNKRTLAMAGLGLTAAASVAFTAPAGAATTVNPHTVSAGVFKAIVASHKEYARGKCDYPVGNPTLTLGPSAQTVNHRQDLYSLSGTYGCNGHGLPGYPVYLVSTTKAKYGHCTASTGPQGTYQCLLTARSSGTAQSHTPVARSNVVTVTLK
jgi:hypothetical protein